MIQHNDVWYTTKERGISKEEKDNHEYILTNSFLCSDQF